jgi:hypothetical protein
MRRFVRERAWTQVTCPVTDTVAAPSAAAGVAGLTWCSKMTANFQIKSDNLKYWLKSTVLKFQNSKIGLASFLKIKLKIEKIEKIPK